MDVPPVDRSRLSTALFAAAAALALAYLVLATGLLVPVLGGYDPADPEGYDHVTVTVVDGETDAERGAVEAAVADTARKRYVGLGGADRLPEDRGMLFVHDDVGERTYVMRWMSFGIDVVFADAGGTITAIHHAPEPEGLGVRQEYAGRAQYVLEVNYRWTAERGVGPGDRLVFDPGGGG